MLQSLNCKIRTSKTIRHDSTLPNIGLNMQMYLVKRGQETIARCVKQESLAKYLTKWFTHKDGWDIKNVHKPQNFKQEPQLKKGSLF